ncbi:hypothetical protein [Rosenbergiella epipactidis]|uniref:hypothetical protein n=1 Tax=Rosenbergiella epipactidis TaxID=1544694 RepID=UPI000789D11B|nr:hypothetical protein [Rosenbergiella epipactidis]KYP87076.1 hypothetical protein WB60_12760 [bacteria symbiont BFo2 of Frankliniella occidentalis]KYP94919.1 hypothetical protein WB67_08820 [bacteria symbiont BFo2 of Frankliniella occidentalis]
MLLRDWSIMEKVMHITYDDLVEKQKLLDRKYSERAADLIEGAQKLLEEYRESLVYSGENKAKIAFIGDFIDGKAEFVKLSESHLDEDYRLTFNILTDLTVSELRKVFATVRLTIYKESGRVFVLVGDRHQASYIIPNDNSAYSYQQVCLAIKNNISDFLDAGMPK